MTRRLDPDRLRALRTKRGFTQWDLALRAGVSIGTVAQSERSRTRTHRPQTLRAFAKALGCTVDDLLTLRSSPAVTGANQEPITSGGQPKKGETSTPGP